MEGGAGQGEPGGAARRSLVVLRAGVAAADGCGRDCSLFTVEDDESGMMLRWMIGCYMCAVYDCVCVCVCVRYVYTMERVTVRVCAA